jgi:hypothetical protein
MIYVFNIPNKLVIDKITFYLMGEKFSQSIKFGAE